MKRTVGGRLAAGGIMSPPSMDNSVVGTPVPNVKYNMPMQATKASAMPPQLQKMFKRRVK